MNYLANLPDPICRIKGCDHKRFHMRDDLCLKHWYQHQQGKL